MSRQSVENQNFTINLYRTTSKILVNGSGYRSFVDVVLPELKEMLDERQEFIEQTNKQFKLSIPKAVIPKGKDMKNKSSTIGHGYGLMNTKRSRKRKCFNDYDTCTVTRRRTRNTLCSESVVEEIQYDKQSDDNNEWESEPKLWKKYSEGEWTLSIARECNRPKGCIEKCGRNNSNEMVRCDGCGGWCHFRCGLEKVIVEDQDFICSKCISKNNNVELHSLDDDVLELDDDKNENSKEDFQLKADSDVVSDDISESIHDLVKELIAGSMINQESEGTDVCQASEGTGVCQAICRTDESVAAIGGVLEDRGVQQVYGSDDANQRDLERYLINISNWYNYENRSPTTNMCRELVELPDYQLESNNMYYYDHSVDTFGPQECQIVVHDGKSEKLEILHYGEKVTSASEISDISKKLLDGMKGSKDKDLFSIILKQKEKIDDLKSSHTMKLLPLAVMNHVNFLAKSLQDKNMKIKELTESYKKEKVVTQELRRGKKAAEDRANESNMNLEKKSKEIMDIQKENSLLKKQNKILKTSEEILQSKITILEKVAADLTQDTNLTVELHQVENSANECHECPKLTKKLESIMKEKANLYDKMIELKERMEKLDNIYQSIIEQKDKTLEGYLKIDEAFDSKEAK